MSQRWSSSDVLVRAITEFRGNTIRTQSQHASASTTLTTKPDAVRALVNASAGQRTRRNCVHPQIRRSHTLASVGVEHVRHVFGRACFNRSIHIQMHEPGKLCTMHQTNFVFLFASMMLLCILMSDARTKRYHTCCLTGDCGRTKALQVTLIISIDNVQLQPLRMNRTHSKYVNLIAMQNNRTG